MQSGFASARELAVPGLRSVLDPAVFSRCLSPVLPVQWGELKETRVHVLQQHRGTRCTVDITVQTTDGQHQLIGKLYAVNRSDVYEAMREISETGFGNEAEFSIPQPLAYLPELNLLLQEKVHGQLATDVFSAGSKFERAKVADRCSRWLAHFHMHAPMSGPRFDLTREVMDYWMNRLGTPASSFADKARLLSQRLETAKAAIGPQEECAGHGGYWHQQIILSDARVSTFDWDHHCLADPGRDVAKFIIELQQLALKSYGSLRALNDTIEVFYETYVATSRFRIAKSLPVYKAAICLKRARHHLRRGGGGLEQAEAMLDEGLRTLAEEM